MHLQATCCAEPLPSLIVFPSLLQCPFCRDASWGLEKSGNLHKLGGRKRASCGLHLPDSRATVPNTAWPLAFIPALPPALSLCQRPRKLVFTLKCQQAPGSGPVHSPWQVSCSFSLAPAFTGDYIHLCSVSAESQLSLPTSPPSGERTALLIPGKVLNYLLLHPHQLLFHFSPSEIEKMKARPSFLNSESQQNVITTPPQPQSQETSLSN